MTDSSLLLQVRGLSKRFNISNYWFSKPVFLHAVDDVSFDLHQGQTLGIVGESGSGKSTLARLLMKLIPATSGQVLYKGRDILPLKEKDCAFLRKDVQMVFQDPCASLNPRIKVGYSVAEPLRVHGLRQSRGQAAAKAGDMFEHVGLQRSMANRFPHEFSGGQHQRINIARALVSEPRLIICDEAVSALDVSVQAQVLNLFGRLKDEFRLTYIFISHDLAVVRYVSDTIIVMYLGEIMELAPAKDLFLKAAHPYTKALVSAIPDPDPRVRRKRILLQGDIPSPLDLPAGCRFSSRCYMAADRCRQIHPDLREVSPGHSVRCHFDVGEG